MLLCAAAMQSMLGELKFSSGKAEWVFRVLFLAPAVLDVALAWQRNHAPPSTMAWRMWLGVAPIATATFLMGHALQGSDAQGGLFVIMLPIIHGLLIVLILVLGCFLDKKF